MATRGRPALNDGLLVIVSQSPEKHRVMQVKDNFAVYQKTIDEDGLLALLIGKQRLLAWSMYHLDCYSGIYNDQNRSADIFGLKIKDTESEAPSE